MLPDRKSRRPLRLKSSHLTISKHVDQLSAMAVINVMYVWIPRVSRIRIMRLLIRLNEDPTGVLA